MSTLSQFLPSGGKWKSQAFTESGTWTRPDGVDVVDLLIVGGGGGGGGWGISTSNGIAGGTSSVSGIGPDNRTLSASGGAGALTMNGSIGTGGAGGGASDTASLFLQSLKGAAGGNGRAAGLGIALLSVGGQSGGSQSGGGGGGSFGNGGNGGKDAGGAPLQGLLGGGGGGATGASSVSPGGGGGGQLLFARTQQVKSDLTITVGSGGAGGVGSMSNGASGGSGLVIVYWQE